MFPNINSDAGDAVLESLAKYYCQCYGGSIIYEKCPKLFECNAVNSIGWLLATWGFVFTAPTTPGDDPDGSGYEVPKVSNDLIRYVKRDTVGRVTREYDWAPDPEKTCVGCDKDVLSQWKAIIDNSAKLCMDAHKTVFCVGGSNYPDCHFNTCCGSDR